MNLTRCVAIASLPALLACTLVGCSTSTDHGVEPIGRAVTPLLSASPTVSGVIGYLNTSSAEVDYVQWQPDSTGFFQGTELDAKVSGSVPDAQVTVTQNGFTGQQSGNSITISAAGATLHGALTGETLTVNIISADGSIQPETFRKASDADYNAALGVFRAAVKRANDQQNLANSLAAAEQTLTRDYQELGGTESTLSSDVSNMGNDVTNAEGDVANTHSDEGAVLSEAATGTDSSTVCGDASGVSGDASGVSGDASGISGDLDGISVDLSGLHDETTTVRSDLKALLAIEPGYTGDGSSPTPTQVRNAISAAASAAQTSVTVANGHIARMNTAVTTAYGYASKASQARGCGTAEAPPTPIGDISSPFAGQGAVSL